jgi:hypothetical protein
MFPLAPQGMLIYSPCVESSEPQETGTLDFESWQTYPITVQLFCRKYLS